MASLTEPGPFHSFGKRLIRPNGRRPQVAAPQSPFASQIRNGVIFPMGFIGKRCRVSFFLWNGEEWSLIGSH